MHHLVTYVAKTQRLDEIKFVEFSKSHRGAFFDEADNLMTSTMFVNDLVKDFLAAGNERLSRVPHPDGGLIQPGFVSPRV